MKNIGFLLALAVLLFACGEEELSFEERLALDLNTIQEHLDENALNATITPDSLFYQDIELEGTGDAPNTDNIVEVRYKGYLLDETVFDQTQGDATVSFRLDQVIQGWQMAVPLLKRGGKGTFYFPSVLGFGSLENGVIEPNTILVFDIELVDFDRPFEEQLAIDIENLQTHIDSSMLELSLDEDLGIFYKVTEQGEGESPTVDNIVQVRYKGYFLDGTVFDETADLQTAEFPLSGVIEGWQRAVPLLKTGGKGTFYIPSSLAYGFPGNASIPKNANLAFDIELVAFR